MNVLAPSTPEISGALALLAALSDPKVVKSALEELKKQAVALDAGQAKAEAALKEATKLKAEAEGVHTIASQLAAQNAADKTAIEAKSAELAAAQSKFERGQEVAEKALTEQRARLGEQIAAVSEQLSAVNQRLADVTQREASIADKETAAQLAKDIYERKLQQLRAATA